MLKRINKNHQGVIYCLICPKSNKIRYVGQTKQSNPIKRYYQHKYQWTRSKHLSHLNSWIKSLHNENLYPIFNIIENNISLDLLNNKEKDYINLLKINNVCLVNTHEGGEQNYKLFTQKEEWKIKRLETLKTSIPWKEKHIRHSLLMKEKHKTSKVKIGLNSLSPEKKRLAILKASQTSTKPVCSLDNNKNIIKVFNSCLDAADFYNIKDSTHIVRVCKGKSKSGKTHGFYFEYF